MASSQVVTIVVYKASGPGSQVPVACKTASVAGSCNRYTGADLAKDSTHFGCVGPPGPVTKIDSCVVPDDPEGGADGRQRPA